MCTKSNKHLLTLLLENHYQQIGYEVGQSIVLRKLKVKKNFFLILNTKNFYSIIKCFLSILFFSIMNFIKNDEIILAIPRCNSRIVKIIVKISSYAFYSYSDGLGDFGYSFDLSNDKKFLGHIGSQKLHNQRVIVDIPLKKYTEKWRDKFVYNESSPTLIIIKFPKNKSINFEKLEFFYQKVITTEMKLNNILLSGNFKNADIDSLYEKNNIGLISKIKHRVEISSIITPPSTLLFTFSKFVPKSKIRLLNFPNEFLSIEARKSHCKMHEYLNLHN